MGDTVSGRHCCSANFCNYYSLKSQKRAVCLKKCNSNTMLTSEFTLGQITSKSVDLKRDINCTIYCWLVAPCSYPPLVLTQEKWGDVVVIFDQIANWFPRTGPSQARESWPFATAASCQAHSTVGSSTSLSLWFLWDRWGACACVVWRKTKRQSISTRPSFSTVVASACCSYMNNGDQEG